MLRQPQSMREPRELASRLRAASSIHNLLHGGQESDRPSLIPADGSRAAAILQAHLYYFGRPDVATVNYQSRTTDPTGSLGSQENAWVRDILDGAEPPKRARAEHHLLDFIVGPNPRCC